MTTGVAHVTVRLANEPSYSFEHYCCGYSEAGTSYSAYWPSIAWFCPFCGELWGRNEMEYKFNYIPVLATKWRVETAACKACGGGEIFHAASAEMLSVIGPDLLRRELEILLTKYEKGALE